jgi:hypothetical protein
MNETTKSLSCPFCGETVIEIIRQENLAAFSAKYPNTDHYDVHEADLREFYCSGGVRHSFFLKLERN